MKKSSCSFNMVKLTVNQQCCVIDMLVARIRIHDNIDPNCVIEVSKWSVTITICSFPYTGKSKELDYTENQHMRRKVVQIIHHYIEPISMVNTIYCKNGNGYFSPLKRHRIINTWSILTNEVSKLLWFNSLPHGVFTFEQWLIVLILWANKNKMRYFFWGVYFNKVVRGFEPGTNNY